MCNDFILKETLVFKLIVLLLGPLQGVLYRLKIVTAVKTGDGHLHK